MYDLLILWRQLVRLAAITGQYFGSISKFSVRFDHCFAEGHLRGSPWSLVGKPRGEQTSGQTIKGHATDMSKPSQLTAGDVFVH